MTAAERRRLALTVGGAALAVGALALAFILESNHESQPALKAVLVLTVGWSFVGSGIVAWLRRPDNNTGRLLAGVGFAWFAAMLTDSNDRVVFTLAGLVEAVPLAVFAHLLLAYPTGELRERGLRGLVASGYALALVANGSTLLVDERYGCGDCPRSVILVAPDHAAARALNVTWDLAAFILLAVMVLILIRRWRVASRPARRALTPVLLSGALTILLFSAGFAADPGSHTAANVLHSAAFLVFAAVPLFFLTGLLRSRLARGGVAGLLVAVRETSALEDAEAGLRRVLRDRELRLAAWLPERGRFVDPRGDVLEDADDDARVTTVVRSETGEAVAALAHDRALLDEPELLDGAVAAARLALQRSRLQDELRGRLDELQRERDFVATVVNSAPVFYAVLDVGGRIVRFNDPLAAVAGIVDDDRVRGRPFWEVVVAPEDAEAAGAALLSGAAVEHEHRWRARDGSELVVAWRVQRIADAQGRPRLLVSGLDVTERKRQEDELRRSRARLVEAGDAERRRLERNLHDGAQQRLVALSLAIRLAQAKLASDPHTADEILSSASVELAFALQELRELARGLHPAVLADRGLGPALESVAERAPVPVELEIEGDGRLPEAVEVVAYYVVAEALTNVAKYAHATVAHVRVGRTAEGLAVEVSDDGIGGADPARGSGLRGLVDRVDALGGHLEVTSPPGSGTRVVATLPVRSAVPQDAG